MFKFFGIFVFFVSFSFAGQLDDLINFALKNNPTLKSFENLINSKNIRSKYKIALPNPVVGFALQSVELEYPFPRAQNPMSGFGFFFSQKYILPAKRERDSFIAREMEKKIRADRELFKKQLIRSLKENYYDFQYSFMLEELSLSIKKEIEDILEVSEEHYIYGRANLADLVFLRVELGKIEERIVFARNLRLKSRAIIEALAGGKVDLQKEKLGEVPFPSPIKVEESPYVKVVEKEINVLRAEEERLKVEHLPDITLTGAYLLRPDIPDLITFKAGITLPLWYERKEKLMVMEKREEIRGKHLFLEGVKLKVKGEYEALKSVYQSLKETLNIVRKEIKDKKQEIESLNIAFTYEKEDFRDLLRAYRELWDLRLKEIKLLVDLLKVTARAEELI